MIIFAVGVVLIVWGITALLFEGCLLLFLPFAAGKGLWWLVRYAVNVMYRGATELILDAITIVVIVAQKTHHIYLTLRRVFA